MTKAVAPIQELIEMPPVVAAMKFVKVDLLMTFSMGDSRSKSLEDIKINHYVLPCILFLGRIMNRCIIILIG